MKTIKTALVLLPLVLVSGCVAVPAEPVYYPGPQAYYAPAPAYYAPAVIYGPSISFGYRSGGQRSHHHH